MCVCVPVLCSCEKNECIVCKVHRQSRKVSVVSVSEPDMSHPVAETHRRQAGRCAGRQEGRQTDRENTLTKRQVPPETPEGC